VGWLKIYFYQLKIISHSLVCILLYTQCTYKIKAYFGAVTVQRDEKKL
jgi:hypothetical protein